MEYIQHYNDISILSHLEFVKPKREEDPDATELLDQFIGGIVNMLLSLLEGSDNRETLNRMVSTLVFADLKDRMVNVFGKFLDSI